MIETEVAHWQDRNPTPEDYEGVSRIEIVHLDYHSVRNSNTSFALYQTMPFVILEGVLMNIGMTDRISKKKRFYLSLRLIQNDKGLRNLCKSYGKKESFCCFAGL